NAKLLPLIGAFGILCAGYGIAFRSFSNFACGDHDCLHSIDYRRRLKIDTIRSACVGRLFRLWDELAAERDQLAIPSHMADENRFVDINAIQFLLPRNTSQSSLRVGDITLDTCPVKKSRVVSK